VWQHTGGFDLKNLFLICSGIIALALVFVFVMPKGSNDGPIALAREPVPTAPAVLENSAEAQPPSNEGGQAEKGSPKSAVLTNYDKFKQSLTSKDTAEVELGFGIVNRCILFARRVAKSSEYLKTARERIEYERSYRSMETNHCRQFVVAQLSELIAAQKKLSEAVLADPYSSEGLSVLRIHSPTEKERRLMRLASVIDRYGISSLQWISAPLADALNETDRFKELPAPMRHTMLYVATTLAMCEKVVDCSADGFYYQSLCAEGHQCLGSFREHMTARLTEQDRRLVERLAITIQSDIQSGSATLLGRR
jgi:hypothetical protein